jgi:hypothetical protein
MCPDVQYGSQSGGKQNTVYVSCGRHFAFACCGKKRLFSEDLLGYDILVTCIKCYKCPAYLPLYRPLNT